MADQPCRFRAGLRHWHPLLPSVQLGRRPHRRQLCGQWFVVFRTASGRVGALPEACPHRRMSLATGKVRGEMLVCSYHGWQFDADGVVHCPLMPSAGLQQPALQLRESHGLIWLRQPLAGEGAPPPLPEWPHSDLLCAGITVHDVPAPLELTLDNFTETEHTTSVHQVFGFRDPASVQLRLELEPSCTRVWNRGPQKPFPRLFDAFIDIRPSDHFANDWVTRFEPPLTVYEQTWRSRLGTLRRFRLRVVLFVLPVTDQRSQLITLLYTPRLLPGPLHGWLAAPIVRALTAHELDLDVRALAQLADRNPELSPRTLGPFDRVLLENRRRISTLYLGG
ncbi:MAG: Rieske 2Fe-2S domain-containing protein [Cyanobacteria bacterium M_surface_10_m1_298]|nr:Rieske 2Fe-2S domain-containing protein [Cyanobacteria bacterium M_surface_10_m1_298]